MDRSAVFCLVSLFVGVAGTAEGRGIPPRPEHPRPDFCRAAWLNLNGPWEFRKDPGDAGLKEEWFAPGAGPFPDRIVVPFPWESTLSEVGDVAYKGAAWYRRDLTIPAGWRSGRVYIVFGAVDWVADVWVNGEKVAHHEGGYTPFEADITAALRFDEPNVLVVRAFDVTSPEVPSGKQTGWYTPTSGIWQTVYIEPRSQAHVSHVRFTPDLARSRVALRAEIFNGGPPREALLLVDAYDPSVGDAAMKVNLKGGTTVVDGHLHINQPKLWTPETPHLYEGEVRLHTTDRDGSPIAELVDVVHTYFGMREVRAGPYGQSPHSYVLLNGRPIYIKGTLNQAFHPDGIYTYPSDDAIRRDVEANRDFGFNCMRIHIKVDEPRMYYWADRLGCLILYDLPNFAHYTERSRRNYEETLRAAIRRDINHPSVIAWVNFNETWGIGHGGYGPDHQAWVAEIYRLTKELDPTRLVEDNSPCRYDHVVTDINSWHFYINDYDRARAHIQEVRKQVFPGSPWNFVQGRVQGSEPCINSEYGGISAGAGDRDVSHCFHYLTNLLRAEDKVVGYIYTELMDIEWEHNGFMNYDRTAKGFGYAPFAPGFTYRDLNADDFVVIDSRPVIEARPGDAIEVPIAISHFSSRNDDDIRIRWALHGVGENGRDIPSKGGEERATWQAYRVVSQKPLKVEMPRAAWAGGLEVTLLNEQGERLAANFVHVDVHGDAPSPRVAVPDERECTIRFHPLEIYETSWPRRGRVKGETAGGPGKSHVEYRIALPDFVPLARGDSISLMMEIAAFGDERRLHWPARRRPNDHPQTDVLCSPSEAVVSVNGKEAALWKLPDAPSDSRGFLSYARGLPNGIYGYLRDLRIDDPEVIGRVSRDREIRVRIEVRREGEAGARVFSARSGRYPIDPTITIRTARPMGKPVGFNDSVSPARRADREREEVFIPAAPDGGATWRFTTRDPGPGWEKGEFDDSGWREGRSGFGTHATPGAMVGTVWNTPEIWIRKGFQIAKAAGIRELLLTFHHDEGVEVFLNGARVLSREGYVTDYHDEWLGEEAIKHLKPGLNTVAAHCRQTGGGQFVDIGIAVER